VATLDNLVKQIAMLSEQISQQLGAHADAHIFTSLPHAGTVRAARLLAEIGDCRGRFPTPEALACLAGVASPAGHRSSSFLIGSPSEWRRPSPQNGRSRNCSIGAEACDHQFPCCATLLSVDRHRP
jgi:hypothetical protein